MTVEMYSAVGLRIVAGIYACACVCCLQCVKRDKTGYCRDLRSKIRDGNGGDACLLFDDA